MISVEEEYNFSVFRENISAILISGPDEVQESRPRRKSRGSKHGRKNSEIRHCNETSPNGNVEELAEFVDYLAREMFTSLPSDLRTLDYATTQTDPYVADRYVSQASLEEAEDRVPIEVSDSLSAYNLIDVQTILANSIPSYISAVIAPPPVWSTTRPEECELCERDWVPLTYHHLIPRSTHDKVLKRGWHKEWELNKVAWLCSACHRCVHRIASNEELAKDWDTVEKLRSRDDIQKFIGWVGRVRWKKR